MVGLQDRDMVSSSWPPIVSRSNAPGSKSPAMPPFTSPESTWRRSYDTVSEYETLSLKINPPRVVIDNVSHADATVIQVDSANRHGCLLEVVQLLTDLDLVISKAHISSDGGWFVDVFHVQDQLGRKLVDEKVISYIQEALGAGGESAVNEVKTCLGRQVALRQMAGHTALELTGTDRPGLLSEISAVLTNFNCNVVCAEVWTHNLRVACVVYVKDGMTDAPVQDPVLLHRIKEQLLVVMRGEDGRNVAKTDVSVSQMHTERRLHQMMFADKDYEPTQMRTKIIEHDDLQISVRNCGDKKYSIVDIKCKDRAKLLFDTVCTLTDMQYVVFHGTIGAEDGLATQEYYIRHMDGGTLDQGQKERVCKCLEAAIERREPEGIRLELRTSDRVGLLSDVTRIFRENGLSVTKADVTTQGDEVRNIFYVTDAAGNPVHAKVVEALRREIGHAILQVKEAPSVPIPRTPQSVDKTASKSFVNMIRSHSERWLWNLGLAMGQPSPGSSPSPPSPPVLGRSTNTSLAASTRW